MAPIEVKDLRKGFCVMVEIDGKPYPAEFLEFTGNIFGNLMFRRCKILLFIQIPQKKNKQRKLKNTLL